MFVLRRVFAHRGIYDEEFLHCVCSTVITTTSAFTGIRSDVAADACVAAAVREAIEELGRDLGQTQRLRNLYNIEEAIKR